ncbi:hypothetical protein L6164_025932 [Bauhinia variegata]|uniref:Uncharacterized protein n=1 Tax=Bauhinia variegata TaxID=167791 RepID=A0ACB9M5S6_BAUVA|nr:hypothetical protein L6164_025932 [Bauhinia variegata]
MESLKISDESPHLARCLDWVIWLEESAEELKVPILNTENQMDSVFLLSSCFYLVIDLVVETYRVFNCSVIQLNSAETDIYR